MVMALFVGVSICLSIPAHALTGLLSFDTSGNNLSGDSFVTDKYELMVNSKKIMDGVKEYVGGYALKVDGSLYHNVRINPTVIATDVSSLVCDMGDGVLYIDTQGVLWFWYEINGKYVFDEVLQHQVYQAESKIDRIDSNVRNGGGNLSVAYYIKGDNSLWRFDYVKANGTYKTEQVLDDVIWYGSISVESTSYIIRSDNSLWGWGETTYGELGVSPEHHPYRTVVSNPSAGGLGGNTRVQYFIDTPIKILDNVQRIVWDKDGIHAITTGNTVISWSGDSHYDTAPSCYKQEQRPDKQWMVQTRQIVSERTEPYCYRRYIQYSDGRFVYQQDAFEYGGTIMDASYKEYDFTLLNLDSINQPPSSTPTSDVPSAWATVQVKAAIAAELVPAALQSKYTHATTRAEFCALAVALYQSVTNSDLPILSSFSDTTDENVLKMATLGVVNGVGDNKFAPNDKLTREQAATMLSRLAAALGKELSGASATFADNASISDWAFGSVSIMQATGIMGGVGNNTFAPKGDYTREQSIITMMRLFDIVK